MTIQGMEEAFKRNIEFLKELKKIGLPYSYLDSASMVVCLDDVIEFLQRGQKFEEELIQFLEGKNPYPEEIFTPIPKEDFDKINDLLKKEMGYSIDRLSGNLGRKIYKSIIETLREMIK